MSFATQFLIMTVIFVWAWAMMLDVGLVAVFAPWFAAIHIAWIRIAGAPARLFAIMFTISILGCTRPLRLDADLSGDVSASSVVHCREIESDSGRGLVECSDGVDGGYIDVLTFDRLDAGAGILVPVSDSGASGGTLYTSGRRGAPDEMARRAGHMLCRRASGETVDMGAIPDDGRFDFCLGAADNMPMACDFCWRGEGGKP
jgi:hypothetical protein